MNAALPDEYILEQNYPNPFNPTTTFRFGIPEAADVSLIIYDIRGNVVRTIESGYLATGWYEHVWNGLDENDQMVATGLYFSRLQAGSYAKVIKIVMIK
jgi:flagellar hook assembly protein FlgD